MEQRILITGINGYIGTVLADKLVKNGYDVLGIDTDYFKDIILGDEKPAIQTIKQDVRDIDKINVDDVDCIIHLSALSNDPMGDLDEQLTYDINYKATIALAKKAKAAGVKRFIFSSSCSIYGIAKEPVVSEESEVNPLTAYAKSKILSENALKELADEKFCVCLLRNSTVYGYSPRFRNDLVVNNLTTCGLSTGKIKIMSDGTPWRPLIDVRDLSDIFIRFIEVPKAKVNGEIFNIGFKENNLQVKDVVTIIKNNLTDCEVVYTGEHGSDSRSYKVDFTKFKQLFPDLKQEWTVDKSVKDLIKRLREAHYSKNDFESNKYARLTELNELIQSKRITNELYWTK